MADEFDAIVVGAGLAGSTAALRLARGGANVLLLERGPEPGVKNLSGGVLWGQDLAALLPEWWKEMPLERHIVRKRFGFLSADRALSTVFEEPAWDRPPYVAHSVLRARTDAWLARKAEEAGATLVTGVPVERLAWEDARVRGVVQSGETMSAPVTLLCDGANSRVSLATPIRPEARLSADATELGIKEVYSLPAAEIEERFQLAPGQGHAEEWVYGGGPPGVMAGGFLYTNQDTLSLGLIVQIGSLFGTGAHSHDLLERFKLHPAIAPRLEGATLVEYGAKLISSGWASRPATFHGPGWMVCGDAAGFVFSNGLVIQGMNYAIRSGLLAAETALECRTGGRYDARALSAYDRRLESMGVLADFREFEGLDRVKWNPRFYSVYPRLATQLFHQRLVADGGPKPNLLALLARLRRSEGLPIRAILSDGLDAAQEL
ncbi:MAG: FAD-dependent oxidoreductase [Thermoplasmata archaeon]|nr:FAD-dependent oxidoreductase [Thermoplasmata archaeon]MCI4338446.1 FAD-dependent oxidoreductase [Thermoplasmata archaeon]